MIVVDQNSWGPRRAFLVRCCVVEIPSTIMDAEGDNHFVVLWCEVMDEPRIQREKEDRGNCEPVEPQEPICR